MNLKEREIVAELVGLQLRSVREDLSMIEFLKTLGYNPTEYLIEHLENFKDLEELTINGKFLVILKDSEKWEVTNLKRFSKLQNVDTILMMKNIAVREEDPVATQNTDNPNTPNNPGTNTPPDNDDKDDIDEVANKINNAVK